MRDLYRPQWSAEILEEVTRNLREDRGLRADQADRLVSALRLHFSEAEVSGYETLIPTLTCHEKDRHVLAAAIRSRASLVVTFNLKDFPPTSLAPFDIEAWHPDAFLIHLFHMTLDVLITILNEQSGALRKPPTTFERVLETLEQHTPKFVSAVRRYLQDNT
jgi:PIN domain